MSYFLRRTRDGAGDSGPMSMLMRVDPDDATQVEYKHGRPEVGWAIRVGSIVARSYQYQDWWQTTIITEIIEDGGHYVRFRTGNSEYEWSCH